MRSICAIVVDPEVPGGFAFKEVEAPQVGPSEALVKVEAISLNRGEAMMPAVLRLARGSAGIWPER